MQDVARAAGVSKNAVSLAFKNDPQIPLATRNRIRDAARSLGYMLDPVVGELMARLRRSRHPKYQATLALFNTHQNANAFTEHATIPIYVKGCKERAAALGYAIDVFWTNDPEMHPARLQGILASRGIRGAIVVGLMDQHRVPDKLTPLLEEFPVIVTGVRTRAPALHFACVDHHILTMRAAEQVVSMGYRRPGLVIDPVIDSLVEGRFTAGFQMGTQGLMERNPVVPHYPENFQESGRGAFLEWFHSERPDVVLSLYNTIYRWMVSAGIRIPDDVGFAQLEWRPAHPEIAGMNQHNDVVGAAAVDMLVSAIHGNEIGVPLFPKATLIGPSWMDGQTLLRR